MPDTPLVALTLAACGLLTLMILGRALRKVLAGRAEPEHEVEG